MINLIIRNRGNLHDVMMEACETDKKNGFGTELIFNIKLPPEIV